jgi:hypothetical protein
MTALSANYEAKRQDGQIVDTLVKASAVIYKGALLVDKGTGYAEPGTDGSGYIFLGVAVEAATGGSTDGAVSVRINKVGVYQYAKATAVQTDLTVAMYIHDDQTVGTSSTNSVACGYCVGIVDSSHIKLRIDGYAK